MSPLKSLFGRSSDPDELPQELRELLDELKREKAELASLVERATAAGTELSELRGPIDTAETGVRALQDRLAAVAERMDGFDAVAEKIAAAERGAAEILDTRQETLDRIESAGRRAEALAEQVTTVEQTVSEAVDLRREVEELTGASGIVSSLRLRADEVRQSLSEYESQMAQVRDQQSAITGEQRDAFSRYAEIRDHADQLKQVVERAMDQLATVEGTIRTFSEVEETASRAERRLQALKSLADHVTQKTAALETQREFVERAEAQTAQLTDLQWDLQAKLKQAQIEMQELKKVRSEVENMQSLHKEVATRNAEIRDNQERIYREDESIRAVLDNLRDEVRRTGERFDLENRGLEAVSQRIIDLRAGLTEFEGRIREAESGLQMMSDARARAEELSGRLTTLNGEVGRLDERMEQLDALRAGVQRAEELATDLSERVTHLDAMRPQVETAVQEVAHLRATREEVRDALERLRGAGSEIERVHADQVDTNRWLAEVDTNLKDLRAKMRTIDEMGDRVDRVGSVADQAVGLSGQLDERRATLEHVGRRLTELTQMGTDLDQRTQLLAQRMNDADERFRDVVVRAEQAEGVARQIGEVREGVERAERRMAEVQQGVEAATGRAEAVDALSKQVDRVAAEIDQRQKALNTASEHLERAGTLRKESAEAAQTFEEHLRTLSNALTAAEAQAGSVAEHAERLEARAGSLRFAEKRLTQFEEKLNELEHSERRLADSMDTLGKRQASVDAIRADLGKLFEMAERALEDTRSVAAARDEVRETKTVLDEVRERAKDVSELTEWIEGRQKQITAAEGRLAGAEALLMDIRGGLETLRSQKALVDHVIERSGRLTFETKEAEALIATLRAEREIASRIRDAVSQGDEEEQRAS